MMLNIRYYSYIFCLTGLVFSSCKNNDDAPGITATSRINIINLVPDGSSINYYSNGTRQNNYKLGYALASGYLSLIAGGQTAAVKDTLYNTLFTMPVTLKADSAYTLLVTGQASKQAVTGILLNDNVASVIGKAKARFINASPNAPALDVYLNSLLMGNKAYKSVSTFTLVDTGKVTIKINVAGTGTNILTANLTLTTSGVYTLFTYGLYNTTGTGAFAIAQITNH
jgi:hypothetical protein